jgi:hypothetical protein
MKIRFIDAYLVAVDLPREHFKEKFEELRKEPKYIERRKQLQADLVLGQLLCSLMGGYWAIISS